jgi:hypothetical protein
MNTLERTPIEKQIYAKTLFDSGATYKAIQRAIPGIATHTLQAIKENNTYSPLLLDEFKRRLPFKAYKLADDVLDLINRDEIAKAPLGVKMMAFGVAIDKARDMEGSNRPVFNIVSIVNECKQTRDKLELQIANVRQARVTLQSNISTVQ